MREFSKTKHEGEDESSRMLWLRSGEIRQLIYTIIGLIEHAFVLTRFSELFSDRGSGQESSMSRSSTVIFFMTELFS
mgnify:CR=1 FL=1